MNKNLLLLFMLSIFSLLSCTAGEDYIYLSSGGDSPSMSVYKFNTAEIKLELVQKVPLKRFPNVSTISNDGRFLYAPLRGRKVKSRIATFSIADNGKLNEVHSVEGDSGGYITVDPKGEYLWAIGGGTVHAHKLENSLCKDVVAEAPVARGSHAVRSGPDGKFLYIPHILTNKMYQYHFNRKTKKLEALKPLAVDGPPQAAGMSDPRHLMFHTEKNVVYTSNEIKGGISSWKVAENGQLTLWQTESTLPAGFDWDARASDICLSKDNLFAYVANRDNSDRKSSTGNDSIAVFKLDPQTGALSKCIGHAKTGRHVRCVIIDSSGEFLIATGVWSADFSIYKRDKKTGQLTLIKKQPCEKGPMWMSLLKK